MEKLSQFTEDGTHSSEERPNDEDEDENHENPFNSQTFVPLLPTRLSEDRTINEILNKA